jgi:large subunit ribosomal protein L28
MSRKCEISGKGVLRGCNVSHANNKTLRTWNPNLQTRRLFDSESGRWIRVRIATRLLRTIDKKGLAATLRDHGIKLEDVAI